MLSEYTVEVILLAGFNFSVKSWREKYTDFSIHFNYCILNIMNKSKQYFSRVILPPAPGVNWGDLRKQGRVPDGDDGKQI